MNASREPQRPQKASEPNWTGLVIVATLSLGILILGKLLFTTAPWKISNRPTQKVVSGTSVRLENPDLKLATVNLQRTFDSYYKTKAYRAEFKAHKDEVSFDKAHVLAVHKQIMDDLQDVIVQYSELKRIDLVFDVGTVDPHSGAPLVIYSHPGLDVTDDIIALANAGHDGGQ